MLVTGLATIESTVKDFWNRWNGIAVLAEKPEHPVTPQAMKDIHETQVAVRVKWAFAAAIVVLLGMLAVVQLNMSDSILFIVNLTGLVVCGSLVLRELGVASTLSKRLCGESSSTGCDAVLSSKAATVLPGVKLSDAGLAFFAGIITLLLFTSVGAAAFTQAAQTLITLAFFAGIPVTLYSLYYQRQVARTWCRSCLVVVALLWSNVVIQLLYGVSLPSANAMSFITAAVFFILPGVAWILIRQVLNNRQLLDLDNLRLQRFYRSPALFTQNLMAQRVISTTPRPYDFIIGNPEAACQLVIVSSHFCGPCVDTFRMVQTLLSRHGDEFGVTIRFLNHDTQNNNGRKASVQRHMLQYALSTEGFLRDPEKVERMLEAWYATLDINSFRKLYPVKTFFDVDFILERQREWAHDAGITYTPTVIINGRKLESPYSADDLLEFSPVLIELFAQGEPGPEAELVESEARHASYNR